MQCRYSILTLAIWRMRYRVSSLASSSSGSCRNVLYGEMRIPTLSAPTLAHTASSTFHMHRQNRSPHVPLSHAGLLDCLASTEWPCFIVHLVHTHRNTFAYTSNTESTVHSALAAIHGCCHCDASELGACAVKGYYRNRSQAVQGSLNG